MDNITEKQLKKITIHLLSNTYIKKQLKDLILDYLNSESFSELITYQLAGLIEATYTKQLLSSMLQSNFKAITEDPYTRYLFLEYIKDWLV